MARRMAVFAYDPGGVSDARRLADALGFKVVQGGDRSKADLDAFDAVAIADKDGMTVRLRRSAASAALSVTTAALHGEGAASVRAFPTAAVAFTQGALARTRHEHR